MRTLEFTADGVTYRAVVRQGLVTVHDDEGKMVRVHRIDGGRPQPRPDDPLMPHLVAAIRKTTGGGEYLDACAVVRAARDMALADPAVKWRDYESAWMEAREVRESWEEEGIPSQPLSRPYGQEGQPQHAQSQAQSRLPRSSIRRRMVAWGQR
jgi:hypothetical protein